MDRQSAAARKVTGLRGCLFFTHVDAAFLMFRDN